MTTLVRPEGRTDGGRHTPDQHAEPSRFAAWRASWAVALRMARRDVRRHKGRSALVVVMVTVPTLLLSLVVTLSMTSDVRGAEAIPLLMGNGQALLEGPDSMQVLQGPDPNHGFGGSEGEARPIPGFDTQRSPSGNADAVAALVGAPVSSVTDFEARFSVGERRVRVGGLALDGRVGLGERLELVSGRWPDGTDEALVTASGIDRGLPASGPATVTVGRAEQTLAIVGVARVGSLYGDVGLVTAVEPAGLETSQGGWIVRGADPVTWEDVLTLNEYGFRVTSASVLRDPPAISELPADLQDSASGDDSQMRLIAGLGGAMLLIITTLLVGPAFAVSAARQRRTLALAASNGASTPVLRRTVLASALVLGATSAVAGTALGVALTPLVIRGLNRWARLPASTCRSTSGGACSRGIALCAVASTLIAALIPARRLGRLDIVGVMRGQAVSPPPSKVVLAVGVVLAMLGGLVVLGSTGVAGLPSAPQLLGIQTGEDFAVTIGAIVLIVGSLFLVPVALSGVGRLGAHLPTTLRMAARDLARQRSRSAPSVAAVLAAVAGLSFGLTGLASDTEQARRGYTPQTLAGEALVRAWGEPITADAVRAAAPGLLVSENVAAGSVDPMNGLGPMPTEPYRLEFVNIVPPGAPRPAPSRTRSGRPPRTPGTSRPRKPAPPTRSCMAPRPVPGAAPPTPGPGPRCCSRSRRSCDASASTRPRRMPCAPGPSSPAPSRPPPRPMVG